MRQSREVVDLELKEQTVDWLESDPQEVDWDEYTSGLACLLAPGVKAIYKVDGYKDFIVIIKTTNNSRKAAIRKTKRYLRIRNGTLRPRYNIGVPHLENRNRFTKRFFVRVQEEDY